MDDYDNGCISTFPQIPMPLPSEVLTVQTKFQLTINSDGTVSLVIRTSDELELEALLNTWEPIIVPDFKEVLHDNVVEIARYFVGDNCPKCSNKLVKRKGRSGHFIGCRGWPECQFTSNIK